MFYILKSAYLYRSRGYFFLNNYFFNECEHIFQGSVTREIVAFCVNQMSEKKSCCLLITCVYSAFMIALIFNKIC